jgi:streptogramin lyase
MSFRLRPRFDTLRYLAALTITLTSALVLPIDSFAADGKPLLSGRVTSSARRALAGIPVRAHRDNGNVSVFAYTNSRGEYSFPDWSDLHTGSHSVGIELPDFVPVNKDAVTLTGGKTARLDFILQSRQPSVNDANAEEIAMALPGTEDQHFLISQCNMCHSLQRLLKNPKTKEEWRKTVTRMVGARNALETAPGTRDFRQKPYIEPLVEYLTSIRGPDSSEVIPFKLRPRPTSEASTRLVVTEYDLPRGGTRDVYLMRGDPRFAWPHDVAVDPNGTYVWYTDHFHTKGKDAFLGRVDKETGEVKLFPYAMPPGMAGLGEGGPNYPSEAAAHKIAFAPDGMIFLGQSKGIISFDPKTEQFTPMPGGNMFGIHPRDLSLWYPMDGFLHRLDPKTGASEQWKLPPKSFGYDMEEDSQGRLIYENWRLGSIGMFDSKTAKFSEYPTPTPAAGPRRGKLDSKDRLWFGEYWAGRLGVFDPNKGEIKEYALGPQVNPFGAPYTACYSASPDDKNHIVWTMDTNSGRIYKVDIDTRQSTEYFMPGFYELRDITADKTAERPTVWLPVYRAPAKMVKVQVW